PFDGIPLVGLAITNQAKDKSLLDAASTVAHETGHGLGLNHRGKRTEVDVAAERVLDGLARDPRFSGSMKGGDRGKQERAVAIIRAMGRLQPRADETYRTLEAALSRSLDYSELHALESLVRIGSGRAAEIIDGSLFRRPRWDKRTLTYVTRL